MQQMDFFNSTPHDQIYKEFCDYRDSTERKMRAMFAILTEIKRDTDKNKEVIERESNPS